MRLIIFTDNICRYQLLYLQRTCIGFITKYFCKCQLQNQKKILVIRNLQRISKVVSNIKHILFAECKMSNFVTFSAHHVLHGIFGDTLCKIIALPHEFLQCFCFSPLQSFVNFPFTIYIASWDEVQDCQVVRM